MSRVNKRNPSKNYLNRIRRASDETDIALVIYEASFDKRLDDRAFWKLDALADTKIENLREDARRMANRDIRRICV